MADFECSVVRVGQDYRITIPKAMLPRLPWLTSAKKQSALLLLGTCSRFRLLSAAEAEENPNIASLKAMIDAEPNAAESDAFTFQDHALVALPIRLMSVEIALYGRAWRLALPRTVALIMQLRPEESDVAVLFAQGHLEIWTMEALRSSVTSQLVDLI